MVSLRTVVSVRFRAARRTNGRTNDVVNESANDVANELANDHTHGLDDALVRNALDRSPDGLVVCDRDGTIVYANRALEEIADLRPGDLEGRPIEDLVPPRLRVDHSSFRHRYASSPRTRPMGRGLELALHRGDGREVPVEISLSPVDIGAKQYVVASVRDISERLSAEQRLNATREMLALSADRERIARDLHDTVLQRLFGLGLELQATAMNTDEPVSGRLETAVDEIDRIIKEIRTSVFTLGAAQREGSFGAELGTIIAQSARVLGFTPRLRTEGPIEHLVTPELRPDLVATLRESLANISRHAAATAVSVELSAVGDEITLRVTDNGVGIDSGSLTGGRIDGDRVESDAAGNGLRNMSSRAEDHGGSLEVGPSEQSATGTTLVWRVPIV